MKRYEVIEYTHEDIKELIRDMTMENVINILDNLEGRWLPKMPSVYYNEHAVCGEDDYYLIRTLVAIRMAMLLLKRMINLRDCFGIDKEVFEIPIQN